ncbi:unnamed protein product [Pocillopora meandrina]|uniref:Uncharacterized protein n=1 Tax=Pocillopora meandrina TaxID=46732 RepID=A0AAU9XUC1_9CNID|nr:unnamed protein product [Pocillopora meandrina]
MSCWETELERGMILPRRDYFHQRAGFFKLFVWVLTLIIKVIILDLLVIKDLVNDDFKVITYGEFREKYCLSASFLEFYGVTSAIRSAMKSWKLKTPDGKDQGFSVQKLIAATKPTTLAYKILLQKNSTCPRRSQEKWVRDCDFVVVEDLSWRSIYLLPRFCTLSTKIRNFQFKFLHRLFDDSGYFVLYATMLGIKVYHWLLSVLINKFRDVTLM